MVAGYKAEMFDYLMERYKIQIVLNDEYNVKNNISTLFKVKDKLNYTLICSADNYFTENPFLKTAKSAYYSSIYVLGETDEWCLDIDELDQIIGVKVGGRDSWIMIGHAYFSDDFSKSFVTIMEKEYEKGDTAKRLWEDLFIRHLEKLPMQVRKFDNHVIEEFDSLEELREFDPVYQVESGSLILSNLAEKLDCYEGDMINIQPLSRENEAVGFRFTALCKNYKYIYENHALEEINHE